MTSKPRPALLWMFDRQIEALRAFLEGFADVDARAVARAELLDTIGRYELLVPTLSCEIDREVIDRGKRLRIIATPSTGTASTWPTPGSAASRW